MLDDLGHLYRVIWVQESDGNLPPGDATHVGASSGCQYGQRREGYPDKVGYTGGFWMMWGTFPALFRSRNPMVTTPGRPDPRGRGGPGPGTLVQR